MEIKIEDKVENFIEAFGEFVEDAVRQDIHKDFKSEYDFYKNCMTQFIDICGIDDAYAADEREIGRPKK